MPQRLPVKIPNPLEAVIFDMDGTLLDTERLTREAIFETCKRMGFGMTPALHLSMIGTPKETRDAQLFTHFGAEFPLDAYYASCDSFVAIACRSGVPLRPGAMRLLELLCSRGIPTGLATSTPRMEALDRLRRAGIADLLGVVVSRTDVLQGKPHPETFLAAAKALGARPSHCVAVEDSYLGVNAALAAGMVTVMIPDLLEATPQVRSMGVAVLPSLEDLHQQLLPV
jgi:HAD superfamily hydrolase (TIGR01509 family)